MSMAREEAERRYFGPLGFVSADMVSEESASQREVLAFVAGVEYQSGQPVAVTDAMVERGARAAYEWWAENSTSVRLGDGTPAEWDDLDRADRAPIIAQARASLEAALGGEA